jgi:acyl dehydratase
MFNDGRHGPKESNMAHQLPETGYLRLAQIVGKAATGNSPAIPPIFPISRSTWLAGVRSGRFPQPVKLGERITAWRVEDIRALVQQTAA